MAGPEYEPQSRRKNVGNNEAEITDASSTTSNPDYLFSILREICYSMPNSYFHSLVASMPNRVKMVKSHKGGSTKY